MNAFTVWGQIMGGRTSQFVSILFTEWLQFGKKETKSLEIYIQRTQMIFLPREKDLAVMPRLCGGPPFPSVWRLPRVVLIPGSHYTTTLLPFMYYFFVLQNPSKWKLICAYHIRLPWILKETFVRYLDDTRHIITAW